MADPQIEGTEIHSGERRRCAPKSPGGTTRPGYGQSSPRTNGDLMRRSAPILSIIAVLALAAACSTTEAAPSVADIPASTTAAIETTQPAPEPTPAVKPIEAYVVGDRVAPEDVDAFRNAGLSIYVLNREAGEGLVVDPASPVPEEIVQIFIEAVVPKVGDLGMDLAWAKAQLERAGLRGALLTYMDQADYPGMSLYGLPRGFKLDPVGAWERPDFDLKRGNPSHSLSSSKEEAVERYTEIFQAHPNAFMIDASGR